MLNVEGVAVDVLTSGCAGLLCLDLERILSFMILLFSNWINFGLLYYLLRRSYHRLVNKLLLILSFMRNSVNISLCTELMGRDAFFFHFEKTLGPDNIWWVLSCLVDWNCHYFVCTINQKRLQQKEFQIIVWRRNILTVLVPNSYFRPMRIFHAILSIDVWEIILSSFIFPSKPMDSRRNKSDIFQLLL